MSKTEYKHKLAQENYDYRLWSCRNISESNLLNKLYDFGFTRAEARKAVTFIYSQTEKAINRG